MGVAFFFVFGELKRKWPWDLGVRTRIMSGLLVVVIAMGKSR